MNKEIISFLFKGELPAPNPEQIQQARQQKQEKVQTNQGERESTGQSRGGGNNYFNESTSSTNAPQSAPEITAPRTVVKIGRNDRVAIRNVSTGEKQEMKYKQAMPLIENGEWVLVDE